MSNRVTVLGAPLDAITPDIAAIALRTMLAGARQNHVMTPNNEMLVYAASHPEFLALLNRTALNLPDSTGVAWAMRRAGASNQQRVTGVDTVQRLCGELGPESPVFFLGGRENVAGRAAEELKRRNPSLAVAGVLEASPRDDDAAAIVAAVNASNAKLLLVAYGAPRQDEWIDRYLKEMPSVRVAMGIGGTFDFIAGRVQRAPQLLRSLGLEWFWRLLQEPSRLPRIIKAVVVFPLFVLRARTDRHT